MLNEKLDPWVIERMGSGVESLADVEAYHEKRIKEVYDYVMSKSPFYKRHFHQIETALKTESKRVIEYLPLTSQDDLRQYPLEILCTSQSQIERVTTLETSGTTGEAKRIFSTHGDLMNTVEYFRIGMGTFTNEGEKVLILLPGQRDGSIGKQLYTAIAQLGAIPIEHGIVTNLREAFAFIKAHEPQVLVGIPNQILALAKYGLYTGQSVTSVQKVLLSTDRSADCGVQLIKEIWNCEVFRYYGMTEAGFGWGLECEHHKGYHLYESDFYTEIVDPKTGDLLPHGREGEVVVTTLKRSGMPLVRYRTGDLSKIIAEPCSCGSKLKRLGTIEGRVQGVITLRNGKTFTRGDLDDVLTPILRLVDFNASYTKGRDRDSLLVNAYFWGVLPDHNTLMNHLSKVYALEEAQRQELLTIELSIEQVYSDYCPGPHKRMIIQLD